MQVAGIIISFAVLACMVLECQSTNRYFRRQRLIRGGPIFARPRAVWHAPPKGLRYRQLGEFEDLPKPKPGVRERIWQVKPNSIRRRILRRSPCPRLQESREVMAVIREAQDQITRGSVGMAVKSIGTSEIRVCRRCTGGRCVYAHTKVKTTITLAPTCGGRHCKCGFEPEGTERTCKLAGITKIGMRVSNLTYTCDALRLKTMPRRPGLVPAGRLPNVITTTKTTAPTKATNTDRREPDEEPLTTLASAVQTESHEIPDESADEDIPTIPDFDTDMEPAKRGDQAPAPIFNTGRKPITEDDLIQ